MMEPSLLDETDYALMQCLSDADTPLWKKELHTRLTEQEHPLLGIDATSIQTVSRRIDRLHNHAIVTSTIISPQTVQRDFIIAYMLTADGEELLHRKGRALLRQYICERSATTDTDNDRKAILSHLLQHVQVPEEVVQQLDEDCTVEELAAVAHVYVAVHDLWQQFPSEKHNTLRMHFDDVDMLSSPDPAVD